MASLILASIPALLSRRRVGFRPPAVDGGHLLLLSLWALLPPVTLWFVSLAGESQLFLERFFLSGAPALALLWGLLLRAVEPPAVRRMALILATLATAGLAAASGRLTDHCRCVGD